MQVPFEAKTPESRGWLGHCWTTSTTDNTPQTNDIARVELLFRYKKLEVRCVKDDICPIGAYRNSIFNFDFYFLIVIGISFSIGIARIVQIVIICNFIKSVTLNTSDGHITYIDLHTKFHANVFIWDRDMTNKPNLRWRPSLSWISSSSNPGMGGMYPQTKFGANRSKSGGGTPDWVSSRWRPPPPWI